MAASKFLMSPAQLIAHSIRIAQGYSSAITLRQLYYRFIGTGVFIPGSEPCPNSCAAADWPGKSAARFYKRLGAVLSQARKDGDFPLDLLEDRGRSIARGDYTYDLTDMTDCVARAEQVAQNLPFWSVGRDRWFGQPVHVMVLVEKDALSGVFADPCMSAGVSMLACKGYTSVSVARDILLEVKDVVGGRRTGGLRHGYYTRPHQGMAKETVILYHGDHDPDGLQIPTSVMDQLSALRGLLGVHSPIRLERLALTLEQVEHYGPSVCPPMPAKMTSSRFNGYVEATGTTDAWELDALDPSELQKLIKANIARFWDQSIHEANQELVQARRQELVDHISEGDWFKDQLLAGDWTSSTGDF